MSGGPLDEAQIAARHAEVIGSGPRIDPVDREAAAAEVQQVTNRLRGGVVGDMKPLPLAAIPEIMFTMCKAPAVWEKVIDVSLAIQGPDAVLGFRDRELAMLRTAWLCGAPYEFGEHVRKWLAHGEPADDVARIKAGSSAPGWTAHDAAILAASEELHANAAISDATWATLAARLDDERLIALLVVIGQFTATAYFQNAMRLRLEPGNRGLAAD